MLELFDAQATADKDAGTIDVLAIPFGVPISHQGIMIQFDPGSVAIPDSVVPITVEHSGGVVDRIGKLTDWRETDDGLYAEAQISETALGGDVLTLLRDGVITDVSAGVEIDPGAESEDKAGVLHRAGVMDHIAIVGAGAFGDAGSKVLAVHTKESNVDEKEKGTPVEETKDETAAEVVTLSESVDRLEKTVAQLALPGAIKERVSPFENLKEFVLTLGDAQKGDRKAQAKIEEYVLADDTTTTAAGVVPDGQSSEIISIVADSRPFVATIPNDPIGDFGMTVNYPTVTQKPDVDVQAAEKTEVASQATTVGVTALDLITFAGASDVARQLIERSQPSFVDLLFREYAGVYADKTEASAVAAGIAGAGGTAILADLGADAALTYAAFAAASGAIMTGTRRAASDAILSVDKWIELMRLVDSDGRPLLVMDPQGPANAAGNSDLASMSGTYAGIRIWADPAAPAATTLIYNRNRSAAVGEQAPIQLRAEVVSLLGFEMGVYGLFGTIVKYADGLYTLTAA